MEETFDGHGDRLELDEQNSKIRDLNDQFRKTFIGGTVMLTCGVDSLSDEIRQLALAAIRQFDNFTEANDPYGTHEFGGVEIAGTRVWFKVDSYDKNHEYGSPDPSDPSVTSRVLTMLYQTAKSLTVNCPFS